jgi:hypothetical protein
VEPGVKTDQDVRGLALLVRKGMAVWMRGLSQPCARAGEGRAQREPPALVLSAAAPPAPRAAGIERMLVNILAAMTRANVTEVCT